MSAWSLAYGPRDFISERGFEELMAIKNSFKMSDSENNSLFTKPICPILSEDHDYLLAMLTFLRRVRNHRADQKAPPILVETGQILVKKYHIEYDFWALMKAILYFEHLTGADGTTAHNLLDSMKCSDKQLKRGRGSFTDTKSLVHSKLVDAPKMLILAFGNALYPKIDSYSITTLLSESTIQKRHGLDLKYTWEVPQFKPQPLQRSIASRVFGGAAQTLANLFGFKGQSGAESGYGMTSKDVAMKDLNE